MVPTLGSWDGAVQESSPGEPVSGVPLRLLLLAPASTALQGWAHLCTGIKAFLPSLLLAMAFISQQQRGKRDTRRQLRAFSCPALTAKEIIQAQTINKRQMERKTVVQMIRRSSMVSML